VDVRKSAKRPISALLAFLFITGVAIAAEPDSIISEWNVSIQIINTGTFGEWPGVSGIAPIEVSAAAGRIWFIWPESIISLNRDGRADEQTLLGLFSTGTSVWNEGKWTPENGVLCTDGTWRGFFGTRGSIAQLNMISGVVSIQDWQGETPESVYPAVNGNLLVFNKGEAVYLEFEDHNAGAMLTRRLGNNIPPVSMISVSGGQALAAWMDSTSNGIHVADFTGTHQFFTLDSVTLPARAPMSMDWVGELLVLGYPGKLYAFDISHIEGPHVYKLEDNRLPKRWYRLRGGSDHLIVHSPEPGIAAVITAGAALEAELIGFEELVMVFTLDSGDLLENSGMLDSAEKFYGWVLPYIRNFRSVHPLEQIWPELESEVTGRRAILRERLE